MYQKLNVTVCYWTTHGRNNADCFSLSKDESLSLQQHRNLSCCEGHITAPLHHEKGEFFMVISGKRASYSTYNSVCYEVHTFNVGESLKFIPYNAQWYRQKATNGFCVHCSPWNNFHNKTTISSINYNKQWEFCTPQQICFIHRFAHSLKNYCGNLHILWYSPSFIYGCACKVILTSHILAHLTL